jgi:hypothetical protein
MADDFNPFAGPFTVTGKVIIETQEGTLAPKPPVLLSLDEVDRRAHARVFEHGLWANPDAQGNFHVTHVYPGTYIVSTGSSDARPGAAEASRARRPDTFSIRCAGDVELPDRVVCLTGPLPIALVDKNNGGTVRGALEHCALGACAFFCATRRSDVAISFGPQRVMQAIILKSPTCAPASTMRWR